MNQNLYIQYGLVCNKTVNMKLKLIKSLFLFQGVNIIQFSCYIIIHLNVCELSQKMIFRFTENYIFHEPGHALQIFVDLFRGGYACKCSTQKIHAPHLKAKWQLHVFAQVFTRLHPMRKNRLLFHNQLLKLLFFTVFNYDNLY